MTIPLPARKRKFLGLLAAAMCTLAAASSSVPAGAEAALPKRCGEVHARGVDWRVRAGDVGCRKARRVIRFVLTHGQPTQGSPGRAPAGWRCAYGYGRAPDGRTGRAGPKCSGPGPRRADGYGPGYRPLRIGQRALTAKDGGYARRRCISQPFRRLTSYGVRCRVARRLGEQAKARSDCPDRQGRGCYRHVRVDRWRCYGLFPGEGWDFRCHRGQRRFHYSGGT
jgi:hypothetical protein